MIRSALIARARRQHSFTRMLIARHPLIAATGLGRRLIGATRHVSRASFAPPPALEAAPDEAFVAAPLEAALPTAGEAELPRNLAPFTSDTVPRLPSESPTSAPSAPQGAPRDPLVELVRRMQGRAGPQAPGSETETPPALQAPPQRVPLGQRVAERRTTQPAIAQAQSTASSDDSGTAPALPSQQVPVPSTEAIRAAQTPLTMPSTAEAQAPDLVPARAAHAPGQSPVDTAGQPPPPATASTRATFPLEATSPPPIVPAPPTLPGSVRANRSAPALAGDPAEAAGPAAIRTVASMDGDGHANLVDGARPVAPAPSAPSATSAPDTTTLAPAQSAALDPETPQRWAARLFQPTPPQAEWPEPPSPATLPTVRSEPPGEGPAREAPPIPRPEPAARPRPTPVAGPTVQGTPSQPPSNGPAERSAATVEPGSPLDWAARLFRPLVDERSPARAAERQPPHPRPDRPPAQGPVPTPPAETTRRFLRPLVGIDPASAPIFRGPLARAVAEPLGADAVTVGEQIFIAATDEEQTPQAQGLLAHELTHVARSREPRFVPPLLRDLPAPSFDEEQLASAVEARVIAAAEPAQAVEPFTRAVASPRTADPAASAAPTPAVTPPDQASPSTWNGLPAPWEELPDWFTAAAAPAPESAPPTPAPPPAPAPAMTPAAAPAVQLAEVGRSLESTPPLAAQGASPEAPGTPPPDLDQLARQVYTIVKQRLAIERRRSSM